MNAWLFLRSCIRTVRGPRVWIHFRVLNHGTLLCTMYRAAWTMDYYYVLVPCTAYRAPCCAHYCAHAAVMEKACEVIDSVSSRAGSRSPPSPGSRSRPTRPSVVESLLDKLLICLNYLLPHPRPSFPPPALDNALPTAARSAEVYAQLGLPVAGYSRPPHPAIHGGRQAAGVSSGQHDHVWPSWGSAAAA